MPTTLAPSDLVEGPCQGLEISASEAEVGLDIVALAPLVPRLEEDDAMLLLLVLHMTESVDNMTFKPLRRRVDENMAASSRPRRVVQLGMTVG